MIGFLLTALGWLAESFMGGLVGKAADPFVRLFVKQQGVDDDLEKLHDSLANARLTISAMESLRITDESLRQGLKELLIRLKDAAYDADDLLDEFQYRILKQQIEQQKAGAGNRASSSSYSAPPPSKKIKSTFSNYASGLLGKGDDNHDVQRMRKIKERSDGISVDLEKIFSLLSAKDDSGKKQLVSSASRRTSSFSTEPRLFGRDKELQELKDLLLKPEVASVFGQSGVSVLTIDGIGGIGKTTLAQEVFNDRSVKEYFLRIWVCVTENFCTDRLTREIIEYTTKEKCDLTNFAALQVLLEETIVSERFLIVLDDVWNEDRHEWDSLCAPLRSGKPGSKILVTTRSRKIADMVGDGDAIHLQGLDEKSFWEFFKKCAFGSSNSGVHHPRLEAMAKKMICKLEGSPLAARTLGGLLNTELDEQHWKSILDSEIWQLRQEENGIMPALQLSYQYLPPHLKPCFTFCSLFPKDYTFDEYALILIWIGEGLIVPQGSSSMEVLGRNYFHELVNRSFFQKIEDRQFVMHGLIHDVAELISVGESYRIEKGKSHEIPSTVRHLSLGKTEEGMQTRCLTEFSHCNKLRTLMLPFRYARRSFVFDCGVLEILKSIRVLVLRNCGLKELPDSISKLIHLRHLDVSGNYNIRSLPEPLCELYNLQILVLFGCNLESLPHGMVKLINLRLLNGADEIIPKITEIGKLTSLQNLSAFKVLKDNGHKLAELNGLKQLRGGLRITNLENVENKEEAKMASLKSKEHLNRLELEWTSLQESDSDINLHISEQVLEGLQPHHNLRSLTIRGYNGGIPPNWLLYSRLEMFKLENCKRWNDLSVIGQLSQLKSLHLARIPVQTQYLYELFDPDHCKFFSQLEDLVLEGITMLEVLPDLGLLPCIKSLDIRNCPNLTSLKQGLLGPHLKSIRIHKCEQLLLVPVKRFKELASLQSLAIKECPKLMSMTQDEYIDFQLPPSIIELCLADCGNLSKSLPGCLHNLTSLRDLWISNCPNLVSLTVEAFLNLDHLTIENCNELRSVDGLRIKSPRKLKITGCPKLLLFQGVEQAEKSSLRILEIDDTAFVKQSPIKKVLPSVRSLQISSSCEALMFEGEDHESLQSLTSLCSLCFSECNNLQSLPTKLYTLTPLRELQIYNCPQIQSLPEKGLPPSLLRLEFEGCHLALEQQLERHLAENKKCIRYHIKRSVVDISNPLFRH